MRYMVIGLDYHGTITRHEKHFKRLALFYMNAGIPVYVISALKNPCEPKKRREVERTGVPNTGVEIVPFTEYTQIPALKLQVCKRLGVTFMYDDMEAVCTLLADNGIPTAQIR